MKTFPNSTIYQCPVCATKLARRDGQYACANNHSFDIAKEGYVNLLSGGKRNREQGDSREMVLARRDFLGKGHYRKLAETLAALVRDAAPETILDSGCGEGYYLGEIESALLSLPGAAVQFYGFDISKTAIRLAAKAGRTINYAVANVFNLPVADGSVDAALSVFSPRNEAEIARVLKKQGTWIIVTPGPRHLFELKSALYENVVLNDAVPAMQEFDIVKTTMLEYYIAIPDNETVRNLIAMTPYYWKTGRERIERMMGETVSLKTLVAFEITQYRKRQ